MRIAIIGYGKMGRLIEKVAIEKGHEVCSIIDTKNKITAASLGNCDVCIDFTHPESIVENVKSCAALKKNIVIGTTGWECEQTKVKQIILDHQIGCIHAPNFSIGVNLFMKIVAEAASLIAQVDEYDAAGYESHHRQKVDSPSGTAKALAKILMSQFKLEKPMEFTSLRCGSIPGTHTIIFDSAVDQIVLTHEARNREGFAKGAVKAAEWIQNKQGFFTLEDFLNTYQG